MICSYFFILSRLNHVQFLFWYPLLLLLKLFVFHVSTHTSLLTPLTTAPMHGATFGLHTQQPRSWFEVVRVWCLTPAILQRVSQDEADHFEDKK